MVGNSSSQLYLHRSQNRALISHRLGWNRVESVKLTGKYSEPSVATSSRCFFSQTITEIGIILALLRIEF
eukprot:COSAG02_NODE_1088_length_14670_cov_237.088326_13_plen_70_part_00